ncbi:hypothetical protein J0K78_07370 [Halobacillus sp. GSS1]|uniref:hypothetical protein n=1 Tax=Halobacillus sp. GSS1 TaxID=2815919 RepID=UPI001A90B95B|nr:hypothetical protein [Halobacillus sp. GSS1]MBN9654078.1 hypothetical protein [Halobacillus sp. GSS1]
MSLKEELENLENQHLLLSIRESTERLDHILADDFWEIGSSYSNFLFNAIYVCLF